MKDEELGKDRIRDHFQIWGLSNWEVCFLRWENEGGADLGETSIFLNVLVCYVPWMDVA